MPFMLLLAIAGMGIVCQTGCSDPEPTVVETPTDWEPRDPGDPSEEQRKIDEMMNGS